MTEPTSNANQALRDSLTVDAYKTKNALKAGADPNLLFPDQLGEGPSVSRTQIRPIHVAASLGDPYVIIDLVKAGADIDATDTKGSTALDYAVLYGHYGAVDTLIKLGAKVEHNRKHTQLIEYHLGNLRNTLSLLHSKGAVM